MKIIFFTVLLGLLLLSCNVSDSVEKLPEGYEFVYEGGNQNRLIKNHKLIIDSGVVECKYSDDYLLVSVDTTYSMNPENVDKRNLKYLFQNFKKDTAIHSISYNSLKLMIKDKSLENIDITR
ncbi:hypothetical protein [Chryseobacterium salivictor]|uniref:Uncharacterized protein n=1 Tax=Chryseobacterium salivictor TaxID=2547600 RepID=A0A4P6ZFQ9_9FLAO|nr:hypothetical protein [Chryseobacterium salivictor]QBO58398.1 hypothetical protein NBC122_01583 [Chryseobacterium salivictor]